MDKNNDRALDKFFTKSVVANNCYQEVLKIIKLENLCYEMWLEPSAGSGAFFDLLPNNKIGIDIQSNNNHIIEHDFLTYELPNKKFITIGNPPFGRNSSLAVKFFNKCSDKSILIGFIVPKTFNKESVIKRLNPYFHLIFNKELEKNSFEYDKKSYHVPCSFQIWIQREEKRSSLNMNINSSDFSFVTKENADFAIQRVGYSAGKVKDNIENLPKSSHYFIKATDDIKNILKKIDWKQVKYNTAGNPSISKREIIFCFQKFKDHNL